MTHFQEIAALQQNTVSEFWPVAAAGDGHEASLTSRLSQA
jgi:hypothetical protein